MTFEDTLPPLLLIAVPLLGNFLEAFVLEIPEYNGSLRAQIILRPVHLLFCLLWPPLGHWAGSTGRKSSPITHSLGKYFKVSLSHGRNLLSDW